MTVDGERYLLTPARIEYTHLGFEDDGIFTGLLGLDYGGSGQGAGNQFLDRQADEAREGERRREGTAYGLDWIMRVIEVVGVDTWEELRGKRLYALKRQGEPWGPVRGIASLDRPYERVFLFEPHAAHWKEREGIG